MTAAIAIVLILGLIAAIYASNLNPTPFQAVPIGI